MLAPGQRVGYLALSPLMPMEDRQVLRDAAFTVGMAIGWCFPNAVMQYALPDLDKLSIDVGALTRKRDRLSVALGEAGCRVLRPEGTFYLWSRWPEGDPEGFWNRLADRDVFVMPGRVMATPRYFRISLTASEAMVENALPAFAQMGRTNSSGARQARG